MCLERIKIMLERYVIHVNKECNMSCIYCYEKDKTSKYNTAEVVDTALKLAEGCLAPTFGIEFLGGEPMLAFKTIKAVYEALENKYPNRVQDYGITTNGTILTDEQLEYLKNNPKIFYAVSLDGTKWTNQLRVFKNGINSFEIAKANIEKAIKILGADRVSVHMVTHLYNVGSIYNSVKCIYQMGVRSIGVGTVESTIKIDIQYCNRFVKELLEVSKSIKNNTFAGLHIDLFNNAKPKEDVRHYIKDPVTGKTIGESYGRAKNSVIASDVYDSRVVHSDLEGAIISLRECVYKNHWVIMNGDINFAS